MSSKSSKQLFVWDERYDKLGVSPTELYMRQNNLCWLVHDIDPNGKVDIHCTDGEEKALTAGMLNPTFECSKCMSKFVANIIRDACE